MAIDCEIYIAVIDAKDNHYYKKYFLNPAHKWICVEHVRANTQNIIREVKVATEDKFAYSPCMVSKYDMKIWYNKFVFGYK